MNIQSFMTLVATDAWEIGVRTSNGCERTYARVRRVLQIDSMLHFLIVDGPVLSVNADTLRFDGTKTTIRVKVSHAYRFQCPRSLGDGAVINVKPGKTLFKLRRTDAKPRKAERTRSPFEQAFDAHITAES